MYEIRINKNEDGTFVVEQRNLKSLNCGWDEMMGLLSAMTMPHERPCLQWLKKKEKPYEPKDGDFVKSKDGTTIFIVKASSWGHGMMDCYVAQEQNPDELIYDQEGYYDDPVIPVTEEEKQKFIERLHSEKLDWDSENKEVVDWEWEPELHEDFYHPEFDNATQKFEPVGETWSEDFKGYLERKWAKRTEDECQELCDKLNEATKNIR